MGMTMTSKSKILAQMQIKTDKLEVMQQHSAQVREDWQRTGMSDQMIERLQESADKRQRIAAKNKARMEGRPETPESKDNKKMVGKNLLMQQMNYDNEMEDIMTNKEPAAGHGRGILSQDFNMGAHKDSQSSITNLLDPNKKPVYVTGKFEDYDQINIGRYDFAPSTDRSKKKSSIGHDPSMGRAYEEAPIEIPNLRGYAQRNQNVDQAQSHAALRVNP